MALEIEAKMKVSALAFVRARRRGADAERVGLTLETNVFFDTEDRSLLACDEGLRLRTNRDAESGRTHHVVTHKGPQQSGRVKQREETELIVNDAHAGAHLLEKLGYIKTL